MLSCYSCGVSSGSVTYYLIYGTTYCNQSCPDGQYKNSTSFKCLLCSSSCVTCTTNSMNCLTCGQSPFGYSTFFFNNTCRQSCPVGFWGNPSTFVCDACTMGCGACFGSGLSSCTACNNDSSTIYYKWIGATVCSSTVCPDGQFISVNVSNWCQPCSPICVTCSNTA